MPFQLVADVIRSAMRLDGILASGAGPSEMPTAEEYSDALEALNSMLAGWWTRRYLVPVLTQDLLTLPGGVFAQGIGPSGDLVTERPLVIISGFLRDSSNRDTPFSKIGSKEEFDRIGNKLIVGRPSELYYLTTPTNGVIYFDRVTDQSYTLALQSQKSPGSFAAVTDPWTLAPEYDRAVRYNLAIEIDPEYGQGLRPDIVAIAAESLRDIKRLRAANQTATIGLPLGISMDSAVDSDISWPYS